MRFRKLVSIALVPAIALTLSSCGAEDRTTQLLNVDNASQGELVWDDSDPESATWRLQCTSLADFKWLMGLSLQEIKSDANLSTF